MLLRMRVIRAALQAFHDDHEAEDAWLVELAERSLAERSLADPRPSMPAEQVLRRFARFMRLANLDRQSLGLSFETLRRSAMNTGLRERLSTRRTTDTFL
jgi:hypothetical protein